MSYPPTDDTDKAFLREAIQLAIESVDDGGAPFGAVVVHNREVIARAGNRLRPHRPRPGSGNTAEQL